MIGNRSRRARTGTNSSLARTETARRFKALRRNVSAYPEGIFVACTDIADDRSCTVETAPKSFDSLDLMRPGGDEVPTAR